MTQINLNQKLEQIMLPLPKANINMMPVLPPKDRKMNEFIIIVCRYSNAIFNNLDLGEGLELPCLHCVISWIKTNSLLKILQGKEIQFIWVIEVSVCL